MKIILPVGISGRPLNNVLKSIFGVSSFLVKEILDKNGLGFNLRFKDLSRGQWVQVQKSLDKFCLGESLIRKIEKDRNNLILLQSYRGRRLFEGLSCRGQRTRRNGARVLDK